MAFGKKILDIREKEAEYTRKDRTAGILMHFSWLLAPFVVSLLVLFLAKDFLANFK